MIAVKRLREESPLRGVQCVAACPCAKRKVGRKNKKSTKEMESFERTARQEAENWGNGKITDGVLSHRLPMPGQLCSYAFPPRRSCRS